MTDTTKPNEFRCCDFVCTTPFCPLCGKAVPVQNIDGLLRHARSTISRMTKALSQAKRNLEHQQKGLDPTDPDYLEGVVRKRERTLAKWQSWESALVDTIQKASEVT